MQHTELSRPGKLSLAKMLGGKYEQSLRLFMLYYWSKRIPLYMVTEYPRSGGTWLGQLVSGYLRIPFPRNRRPGLETSLLHGHYLPTKRLESVSRIFWLHRDGRDVMVSLYHHLLLWSDLNLQYPKEVLYYRRQCRFRDLADIETNLPAFMELMFTHVPSKLQHFTYPGNWASFNAAWLGQTCLPDIKVVRISYEELLADAVSVLAVSCVDVTEAGDMALLQQVVDDYSFERQTRRSKGQENKNAFLRKGIAGDWRNYFSRESARVFDHYAGDVLIELGYEKDRSWIDRFS